MHLNIALMLDALSGFKELRHEMGGQYLCEVARLLDNHLDIWQSWPVLKWLLMAWSMIVALIAVYSNDILISSQSCYSSAQN